MNVSGINVDRLKRLCADIYDYLEKLEENLTQTYDVLDRSSQYYNGTNRREFYKKVSDLKLSINVIYANINSYIDDYNKVITSYENNDQEIVQTLKYDLLNEIREEK